MAKATKKASSLHAKISKLMVKFIHASIIFTSTAVQNINTDIFQNINNDARIVLSSLIVNTNTHNYTYTYKYTYTHTLYIQ